eukprot:10676470-Alexandrium_andersonii.AAC.1
MAPARSCGRRRQPGRAPVGQYASASSIGPERRLVSLYGRRHSAHAGCLARTCGREHLAVP